jgi:hypothetical protein
MPSPPVKAANIALHAAVLASLCVVALLVPLANAQEQEVATPSDDAFGKPPPAVGKRREAIAAELQQLRAHPWAAEYYRGDGLGANITMSLAPQSGVAAVWTGCMGLYGSNEGRIQEQPDGRLVFRFNQANEDGFGGFPDEVVPVRWGTRRYLVPGSRMLDFVNAINHGDEPRGRVHGQFLLARGDEAKPATGVPALPTRFLQAIRHKALDVGVLKVEPIPDKHGHGFCEKRYRVTVDHGDADGLVPGVALRVKRPARAYADLRIDAATASQATGEIFFYESDCARPESVPDRHWTFTTGHYANGAEPLSDQF